MRAAYLPGPRIAHEMPRAERRVVRVVGQGHEPCEEGFAKRVLYRGAYRVTLCAHTESDVRASCLPPCDDDAVLRFMLEEIERMQRQLGAER